MGEITNRDNKKMLILFAEMVAALATILIAVLAMKIPVWVHAVVAAVQLVAGAFCGRVVFCLLCILIYVFAILTLREARA